MRHKAVKNVSENIHRRPAVEDYSNFREYLRDFLTYKRNNKFESFSLRSFLEQIGFKSYEILRLILEGKRRLAPARVPQVAQALQLSKGETQFFTHLVMLNQARTPDERRFYAQQVLQSSHYKKVHPLRKAEFKFLSHWYYSVIYELASFDGFKEDPQWIAESLSPRITAFEAKRALNDILALGLLKRDENGRIAQTDIALQTEDEFTDSSIRSFHREMIQLAQQSIERYPTEERHISSVTIGISAAKYKEITEMINRLRKDIIATCQNDKGKDKVAQFNFQIFPLTALPKEGGK